MSDTNRGAERAPSDFYPTPEPTTGLFFRWAEHALPTPSLIVDPCAGNGAILRVAERYGHECHGVEVRPEEAPDANSELGRRWGWLTADALAPSGMAAELRNTLACMPAAIVTNPPYSLARQFIETWAPSVPWSAWLLRLNFAGSQKRASWLMSHRPSHILVLPKRPSFTGGRTDATEYAWFVWPGAGRVVRETRFDWLVSL